MRDASHNTGPVEPVDILQDQPDLPHQYGVFKIGRQSRCKLCDEKSIVGRQRGDELGVYREVVVLTVTGRAGSSVAVELLVVEEIPSLCDQHLERSRRGWVSGRPALQPLG